MVHSDNQTHAAAAAAPRPAIATVAELRASGHAYETVKDEIRRNLLAAMRAGEHRFPGIIGFDQTVIPQLERALLAGHDTMLLGERGQGKTRLIRTLPELLDEWTPAVAGCEINDHPYQPVCARCRRLAAEQGDARHQRRRPDRGHRPGEGGRGQDPGRPGNDPLRAGSPDQPGSVLPERAS